MRARNQETIKVEGDKEIAAALRAIPDKMRRSVMGNTVRKGARVLRDDAKSRITARDSGKLASEGVIVKSVPISKTGRYVFAADVGLSKKTFYGMYFEFGGGNVQKQPFLTPAYESKKYEVLRIIMTGFHDELHKAARKAARAKGASTLK